MKNKTIKTHFKINTISINLPRGAYLEYDVVIIDSHPLFSVSSARSPTNLTL